MKRLMVAAFLCATAIWGQSGILAPHLGYIHDRAGTLRPVYGMAANLIAGEPLVEGVLAAAVSRGVVWMKTEDKLRSMDAQGRVICEMPAPPGPALLSSYAVLYPETMELQPLGACGAESVSVDFAAGEILSFASLGRTRARTVIRRESQLWLIEISLRTGRGLTEIPLPDISSPVLLRDDGSLCFTEEEELVIRHLDGSERRVVLGSHAIRLAELGCGWIHVVTSDSNFAFRLGSGQPEVYRLPEVAR